MTFDELSKKWKLAPRGSVGDGWVPLLDRLLTKLVALETEPKFDPTKDITQIKEKFGGLRFYVFGASSEAHELVSEAEKESYRICEVCGAPGEPRDLSWIQTLCDKHFKED